MRIPEHTLEEIRDRVSILEVVGNHVALKRTGKNWKGLCPFHPEKTPSFTVNDERGSYYCFGCQSGGSVFKFLMEIEGRTFRESVEILAGKAGVVLELEEPTPEQQRAGRERDRVFDVMELAAKYYRHQLAEGRAGEGARKYLATRQVPEETSEEFRLGCAPPGWDNLCRFLAKKGYDLELAEKGGLAIRREKGGFYDRLRDRLVFPITDTSGRVISFGGRVLGEGDPKYLNGAESPIFKKAEVFYGMYQGRDALRRNRRAFLMEGYMDVVSLHAVGHEESIATMGTSVTREHVRLLKRRVDEAVLVYDGDEAGKKAMERSLETFLAESMPARAILLPKGEDPDSFVKKGGDLGGLAESAPTLFETCMSIWSERCDLSRVEGRMAALDLAVEPLRVVTDPIACNMYAKMVAETLGVEEELLLDRVRKKPARHSYEELKDRERAADRVLEKAAPPDPRELAILKKLVFSVEDRPAYKELGVSELLTHAGVCAAAEAVANSHREGGGLLDEVESEGAALISRALAEGEQPGIDFKRLALNLTLDRLREEQKRLSREIGRAETGGDTNVLLKLSRDKVELDKKILALQRESG